MTEGLSSVTSEAFVRRAARAWVAAESLLGVLTPPIRVSVPPGLSGDREAVVDKTSRMQRVLDALSDAADTPRAVFVPAATRLTSFETVLGGILPFDDVDVWAAAEDSAGWCDRICDLVADARATSFPAVFKRTSVRSFDGVVLRAYTSGDPTRPAVLIIPPCGMPAELCEAWLVALADTHFVVTAETRHLFGGGVEGVPAADIAPQVRDVFALLDHFEVADCHVMGICGGAVPALLAGAEQDRRIRSISVWHGDFELGPDCPKTSYQEELRALVTMAAQSPERARGIYEVFRSPRVLKTVRLDLAHFLLYPYASADLLFRYAILNGAIMRTDVSHALGDVARPTLVVTSQDDHTAHPAGSLHLAERLRHASLHVEPTGDHLSLFEARPELTALLKSFLADQV